MIFSMKWFISRSLSSRVRLGNRFKVYKAHCPWKEGSRLRFGWFSGWNDSFPVHWAPEWGWATGSRCTKLIVRGKRDPDSGLDDFQDEMIHFPFIELQSEVGQQVQGVQSLLSVKRGIQTQVWMIFRMKWFISRSLSSRVRLGNRFKVYKAYCPWKEGSRLRFGWFSGWNDSFPVHWAPEWGWATGSRCTKLIVREKRDPDSGLDDFQDEMIHFPFIELQSEVGQQV